MDCIIQSSDTVRLSHIFFCFCVLTILVQSLMAVNQCPQNSFCLPVKMPENRTFLPGKIIPDSVKCSLNLSE